MVTLKELVLDHLVHTFEQEAWQPSLAMAVEGLTAAQAAWKPAPERHSIWQIVRHILHWKRGVLAALDGDPLELEALERADWPEASGDEAVWQSDVRALHEQSAELRERLEARGEAGFSETYVPYKGKEEWTQPLAIRIVRVCTHDVYHAGQIRYLRALQGA
jgi:uncharacterized damage-inducible protein DinB